MNSYKTSKREIYFHVAKPFVDQFGHQHNGATVFARQEGDKEWRVSAALCSVNDHFSRPVGRAVARRRYFQQKQAGINAMLYEKRPMFDDVLDILLVKREA